MLNIIFERSESLPSVNISTILNNQRIKLPLIGQASFLHNLYKDYFYCLNNKDSTFVKIDNKNIEKLYSVLEFNELNNLWIDLQSPSATRDLIKTIKKVHPNCFIMAGLATCKKDVDLLEDADGIIFGTDKIHEAYSFSTQKNIEKTIIELSDYIDSKNKISIAKYQINDSMDYIKLIALGADFVIKDDPFSITKIYKVFDSFMKLAGVKDIEELKKIKYKII